MQFTILYIALGPGPIKRIDLSHLLYGDTWSWLLYTALLATSVLSVGISFSKVMGADITDNVHMQSSWKQIFANFKFSQLQRWRGLLPI